MFCLRALRKETVGLFAWMEPKVGHGMIGGRCTLLLRYSFGVRRNAWGRCTQICNRVDLVTKINHASSLRVVYSPTSVVKRNGQD